MGATGRRSGTPGYMGDRGADRARLFDVTEAHGAGAVRRL